MFGDYMPPLGRCQGCAQYLQRVLATLVGRTPGSAADPLVGLFQLPLISGRVSRERPRYFTVMFYRRRLPHILVLEQPIFLTFRLHAVCHPIGPPQEVPSSGQAFAALDRLLDEAGTGPFTLAKQPSQIWSSQLFASMPRS